MKALKKKSRFSKPKKSQIQKMETQLDNIWRHQVKERDEYKCKGLRNGEFPCNSPLVEAHHIQRRAHKNTRWKIDNGISLCPICHNHGNKVEMDAMIKKVIGQEKWNELETLSRVIITEDSMGFMKKELEVLQE